MPISNNRPVSNQTAPAWHAGFLRMLPAINRHAEQAFRRLNAEARADAVQEVMANTFISYAQLYQRGRAHLAFPSVLVRYAAAQFRRGRRVGTRDNCRDLLSPLAKIRRGVYVNALDRHGSSLDLHDAVVEGKNSTPADIAAFRIDFSAWLKSLPPRERGITQMLAGGETTNVTARHFRVSAGRISQVRRELALSWRRYQGELTDDALENSVT